jgi:N,N'-diacetyllegionaminate synthase
MMRTIIIAEAGVNHNGDYELAKQMVVAAKDAGADYVKFQTAIPKLVISRYAEKAEYQKNTTNPEQSQLEMSEKIHLPLSDYISLKLFCEQIEIKFLSTPFDLISVDLLSNLGMDFFKIPSGEITNYPYLKKIAQYKRPVILSTGMSTMDDIENAMAILIDNGLNKDDITILHCNTEYPTPFEDVNLRAMQTIAEKFDVKVGYSDHTQGIEASIAAVALGATVIEKHFTLSRDMEGPDHKASLEPDELKAMVVAIRNVEKALGNREKQITDSERKNMNIARKSIVAAKDIKKGAIFAEDNITVKRPGNGISPMRWEEVLGKTANRDFCEDELIEL